MRLCFSRLIDDVIQSVTSEKENSDQQSDRAWGQHYGTFSSTRTVKITTFLSGLRTGTENIFHTELSYFIQQTNKQTNSNSPRTNDLINYLFNFIFAHFIHRKMTFELAE